MTGAFQGTDPNQDIIMEHPSFSVYEILNSQTIELKAMTKGLSANGLFSLYCIPNYNPFSRPNKQSTATQMNRKVIPGCQISQKEKKEV